MGLKFSKEQQVAYDGLISLFSDDEPKSAILTGAAGTGKTFLCDALAKKLDPVLCALTHKAAEVLAEETGREVLTLAKILKQKKYDDLNTGERKFVTSQDILLPTNKSLLFIDESSMMNEANFKQVQNSLMNNYSVLFIGDKFQLPPVNEDFTQAFSQDLPTFELIEPQRFDKDSGIAATATTIRKAMMDGVVKIAGMRDILAKYDDVIWTTSEKAVPMMIEAFKQCEDANQVRMLSFTNKRVEAFNYHLKKAVTGDADRFMVGDLLMANAAFSKKIYNEAIDAEEDKVVLKNNQSVQIEKIREINKDGIECYQITILNGSLVVFVPVDRFAFEQEVAAMKRTALSYPSGSKDRRVSFAKMFALMNAFADLRLNYAQTVHKSQGSSYETCFFDLEALNSDRVMGKHLLYTGVTRAKKTLVLFK